MATLKPYPHYEIQVKDNSIRDVRFEEVLPVHRALYVMRAEKGPVGEPIWCRNLEKAISVFGAQTFNETSPYFSPQAFFLKNTLRNNGAFIVRALDSNATNATLILQAEVENADITQYVVDENPNSDTYGQRIIDLNPGSATYGEYIPQTTPGIPTTTSQPFLIDGEYVKMVADSSDRLYPQVGYVPTFLVLVTDDNGKQPGEAGYQTKWGNTVVTPDSQAASGLVYQTSATEPPVTNADWAIYTIEVTTTNPVPVTEPGIKITWRTRVASEEELLEGLEHLEPSVSGDTTIYPILAIEALYPGAYGNDLAFRFFYDKRHNSPSAIQHFDSVFNNFSVSQRDFNSSSTYPVVDKFGKTTNVFTANPTSIDKESGIKKDMAAVMSRTFDDDNNLLPYTIYTFEDNYKLIGDKVVAVETAESLCATEIANDGNVSGYQVNILSGLNCKGVPYDHVHVVGRLSSDSLSDGMVLLDANIDHYLNGGTDGNGTLDDEFLDHSMYRFCKLYMNPKIVDKFRYPFTHLYDVGYSITTKHAMIDFINVRDDVMVELSTQVLLPNTWVEGAFHEANKKLNDMEDDISVGQVLRERALLMRESIRHNTDTCRVAIYTQAGYPVSAHYDKPVPFTFWSAMQNALYGNGIGMSQTEPRGWPYSYNTLFKHNSWAWMNYDESGKEYIWNSGLNYCQYADMTRIFYPALRTVYRHESSVLVDQWVVNAIVYTKHVCRKAWGMFVGRNDSVTVLQSTIKNYLEAELSTLYNGKYDFTVTVYQTEEEKAVGYVQHVKVRIVFPATMRVLDIDIEVNREGITQDEEA